MRQDVKCDAAKAPGVTRCEGPRWRPTTRILRIEAELAKTGAFLKAQSAISPCSKPSALRVEMLSHHRLVSVRPVGIEPSPERQFGKERNFLRPGHESIRGRGGFDNCTDFDSWRNNPRRRRRPRNRQRLAKARNTKPTSPRPGGPTRSRAVWQLYTCHRCHTCHTCHRTQRFAYGQQVASMVRRNNVISSSPLADSPSKIRRWRTHHSPQATSHEPRGTRKMKSRQVSCAKGVEYHHDYPTCSNDRAHLPWNRLGPRDLSRCRRRRARPRSSNTHQGCSPQPIVCAPANE